MTRETTPDPTPAALARQAASLRRAQTSWATAGVTTRADILRQFAAALERARPALVAALLADTGRRRLSEAEVSETVALIHYWAAEAPRLLSPRPLQPSSVAPGIFWSTQAVPYALAGFLTPWNFPLTLALIDAIPALLAGAAVLLKPSEAAPHLLPVLQQAVKEVPALAAVCAVVAGGATTGEHLTDLVDIISFTGSVAVGRKVAIRAARRLVPAILELGGKDAAIVCESADIERASDAILRSAIGNSGQSCLATERTYAVGRAYEPLVAALVRKAGTARLTDSKARHGHLAPLVGPRQGAHLQALLADALAKGAQIVAGGLPANPNGWLPTIVTDVRPDMRLLQEETFGPLLPVLQVASVEAAIRETNASRFGLAAAVFAEESEALAIAHTLCVGAVSINDCGLATRTSEPERDAFGVSGLGGSRSGPRGLTRFLRQKALLVQRGCPEGLAALSEEAASPLKAGKKPI